MVNNGRNLVNIVFERPLDDSKKKSIVEIAKTNYGVYFTVKGNKKLGVLGNFDFTINW